MSRFYPEIYVFKLIPSRPHPGQDGGAGDEEMEFLPPLSYKNREEWKDGEDEGGKEGENGDDPVDGEHDVDMRVGVEGKREGEKKREGEEGKSVGLI